MHPHVHLHSAYVHSAAGLTAPIPASLSNHASCCRADKAIPASLDTFGWCTWDAFYFTVSAQGVGQGLGSLKAGGAPPQWLVIDDGWQVWTFVRQSTVHTCQHCPVACHR